MAKLDGNDKLESLLQDVIASTDKLAWISEAKVGLKDDGDQK
jgi:hypothetical protein